MANATPVPDPKPTDWVRFMSKVTRRGDGCWEWVGSRYPSGYGEFSIGNRSRRAHRVIYCWLNGEPGLPIDHTCNHPWCVNPKHLRAISQRENVLKPESKSRTAVNARKERCVNGHDDWFYPNKTPGREHWRQCRTCARNNTREFYRRKRQAEKEQDR